MRVVRVLEENLAVYDKNNIQKTDNQNLANQTEVNIKTAATAVTVKNLNFTGSHLSFSNPTVLILEGDTVLRGQSETLPLIIDGKIMLVQNTGTIDLENVQILDPKFSQVINRNWSGSINIISSKANLHNVVISGGDAEDALNIVDSYFEIKNLAIIGAFSDAIDLDFSNGTIEKLSCIDIGNDCLDTSDSIVTINTVLADRVLDKGISAGENSIVSVQNFKGSNLGVGLVSKDGSSLVIDSLELTNTKLAVSTYVKKPEYSSPSITVHNHKVAEPEVASYALISLDSTVKLPVSIIIKKDVSLNIENRMYGVEFGKRTEK